MTLVAVKFRNFILPSPYLSTAIWSPQNRACYHDGRQVHQPPPVLCQHFYENGGAKELWEWALECPESSPPQPPSLNLSKYRNWRSKITKTNNSPLREKKFPNFVDQLEKGSLANQRPSLKRKVQKEIFWTKKKDENGTNSNCIQYYRNLIKFFMVFSFNV